MEKEEETIERKFREWLGVAARKYKGKCIGTPLLWLCNVVLQKFVSTFAEQKRMKNRNWDFGEYVLKSTRFLSDKQLKQNFSVYWIFMRKIFRLCSRLVAFPPFEMEMDFVLLEKCLRQRKSAFKLQVAIIHWARACVCSGAIASILWSFSWSFFHGSSQMSPSWVLEDILSK